MSLAEDHSQSATPTPPFDHAPSLSDSIYQSAYLPTDLLDEPNVQASLYHSAIDPFQEKKEETFIDDFFDSKEAVDDHTVDAAKERKQRKSLMCRERQFCAQLAINEVLLSISSRGERGRGGGLLS